MGFVAFCMQAYEMVENFRFSPDNQPMKRTLYTFLALIAVGLLLPQPFQNPVEGGRTSDINPNTFWAYPWGRSVTHKGVDVFGKIGTPIRPSTPSVVLFAGENSVGGNVVLALGPKWRLHYYAHLDEISTTPLSFVGPNTTIGTLGDSGNAAGRPAHLHYSIVTLVPYPWRIDGDRQGWKKMFYLNPLDYLD